VPGSEFDEGQVDDLRAELVSVKQAVERLAASIGVLSLVAPARKA
jgi:hypothetical protein